MNRPEQLTTGSSLKRAGTPSTQSAILRPPLLSNQAGKDGPSSPPNSTTKPEKGFYSLIDMQTAQKEGELS
jgi:hypothetical protein